MFELCEWGAGGSFRCYTCSGANSPHSFLCEDDVDVGDVEVKDDVDVGDSEVKDDVDVGDFEVKDDDDEGVDDDGLLMVIPGCQSPQCVKKKKMRAPPKSLSMLGLA